MSRKFAVPVLLLALIPAVAIDALAASSSTKDDIIRFGGKAPRTDLQFEPLEPGSMLSVQTGTPLASSGTFCTGDWMGERTDRAIHTFCGGDVYYCLQDPSLTIPFSWNPAGCTSPFKFNVTAINMEVSKRPTSEGPNPFGFSLQPIVFDADLASPGCPVPGGVKCAGPVYMVTLTGGSSGTTYTVNLPFTIECCVNGPYFAAVNLVGSWACDIAQVTTDDQTLSTTPPAPPPQVCHQYVYDALLGARYDWIDDFYSNHLRLYSEGFTPTDVAAQCTPGACEWQWWYDGARQNDDWTSAYALPTDSRKKLGVRYTSHGLDTLKSVSFLLYYPSTSGTPDITVEIRAGDGAGSSCGVGPLPGTLLYSVTVPYSNLKFYPLTTDVTLPDITWGVLNGGPPQSIFVTLSEESNGTNGVTGLAAGAPTSFGCQSDPHTIGFYGPSADLPGWHYLGEAPPAFRQREIWMDALVCKEHVAIVPPPCSTPGADYWSTWMHDYRRTGSSAITIDNPCKIRAKWSNFLPHYSNFTEPVIAGGKVYVSSDQELSAFDLASGSLVGTVSYEWERDNRCNVSVEGNRVFLTDANYGRVSCWDTTLTSVYWSRYLIPVNRFGVTAVYSVGSDPIVAVGTEENSYYGHGWLYALDARTGSLYTGWAVNPVALDKGAVHAPAFDGTNLYVGTCGDIWRRWVRLLHQCSHRHNQLEIH